MYVRLLSEGSDTAALASKAADLAVKLGGQLVCYNRTIRDDMFRATLDVPPVPLQYLQEQTPQEFSVSVLSGAFRGEILVRLLFPIDDEKHEFFRCVLCDVTKSGCPVAERDINAFLSEQVKADAHHLGGGLVAFFPIGGNETPGAVIRCCEMPREAIARAVAPWWDIRVKPVED